MAILIISRVWTKTNCLSPPNHKNRVGLLHRCQQKSPFSQCRGRHVSFVLPCVFTHFIHVLFCRISETKEDRKRLSSSNSSILVSVFALANCQLTRQICNNVLIAFQLLWACRCCATSSRLQSWQEEFDNWFDSKTRVFSIEYAK